MVRFILEFRKTHRGSVFMSWNCRDGAECKIWNVWNLAILACLKYFMTCFIIIKPISLPRSENHGINLLFFPHLLFESDFEVDADGKRYLWQVWHLLCLLDFHHINKNLKLCLFNEICIGCHQIAIYWGKASPYRDWKSGMRISGMTKLYRLINVDDTDVGRNNWFPVASFYTCL